MHPACQVRRHARDAAILYLGFDLDAAVLPADDTEFFERAILPFDQVLHWVNTSGITDSLAVIAVLQAARLLSGGRLDLAGERRAARR